MVGGLRAVGGSQQLIFGALVLLAVGNQRFQVGETVVVGADDDDGGLGHVVCNRGKGLDRVGAHLIDDGAGEVRQVDEADGLTVRLCVCQLGPADGAGAALDVLDDDGLADVLLGVLSEDTGGVVGAGACLVGHDHAHGAGGRKVRVCGGRQRKDHAQCHGECQELFHLVFLQFQNFYAAFVIVYKIVKIHNFYATQASSCMLL